MLVIKNASAANLSLKPRACSVDKHGQCNLDIVVVYQVKQPACLFVNDTQLTCTNNTELNQYTYSYNSDQPLVFSLVNQQSQPIVEVEFLRLQLSKFRRRQRNPWSLF
ncbi:DUF3019 domain-containing protein [Saccharobesus litoralis]|nr:DUF3019 domain-containing protein [Saccharobesus litoralis]